MLTIQFVVDGQVVGIIGAVTRDANNTFSTGSHGFSAQDKAVIAGKRYQVSCNIVEIGSSPAAAAKAAENEAKKQAKHAAKNGVTVTVGAPPVSPGKTGNAKPANGVQVSA